MDRQGVGLQDGCQGRYTSFSQHWFFALVLVYYCSFQHKMKIFVVLYSYFTYLVLRSTVLQSAVSLCVGEFLFFLFLLFCCIVLHWCAMRRHY